MTQTRTTETNRRIPVSLSLWGTRWAILLALTSVALQGVQGHVWIWGFMIGAALTDLVITLLGEARLARRREKSHGLLEDLKSRLDEDNVAENR